MRSILLVLFLIVSLPPAGAESDFVESEAAASAEEAEHAARMTALAERLLSATGTQQQAAGLLLDHATLYIGGADQRQILNEAEAVDRLYMLIEQADSAITRALLARLCAVAELQADCRRHGLDEAIVRHDEADLLARLYLVDDDDEQRHRDLVVAAGAMNEFFAEHALILLDALDGLADPLPSELLFAPLSVALVFGPPLSPIASLCGEAATNDPELDQACLRLLNGLIDGTGSLLLEMVATRIMAQRAEAQGNIEAVETYENWRTGQAAWMQCASAASESLWEAADLAFMREYLEEWQRRGEVSAMGFVAEKAGAECGPPESSPLRNDG